MLHTTSILLGRNSVLKITIGPANFAPLDSSKIRYFDGELAGTRVDDEKSGNSIYRN